MCDPIELLAKLEEPIRLLGCHIAEEPYFYTALCRLAVFYLSDVFLWIACFPALSRLPVRFLDPRDLSVLSAAVSLFRKAAQSHERGDLEGSSPAASDRSILALFVLAGKGTHRGHRSVLLDEAALPRYRLLSASHRFQNGQSDVGRADRLLVRLSALFLSHDLVQMHHLRQFHQLSTHQSPSHLSSRRRLRALLHRGGPAEPIDFAGIGRVA